MTEVTLLSRPGILKSRAVTLSLVMRAFQWVVNFQNNQACSFVYSKFNFIQEKINKIKLKAAETLCLNFVVKVIFSSVHKFAKSHC
jgi:hypothetical protein